VLLPHHQSSATSLPPRSAVLRGLPEVDDASLQRIPYRSTPPTAIRQVLWCCVVRVSPEPPRGPRTTMRKRSGSPRCLRPCPRAPLSTAGSVRPHPGLWSFVPPRQHRRQRTDASARATVPHSPRVTSRLAVTSTVGPCHC